MSVIPRLASTVVLIDELSRVYLTKRPKTLKFLGGFHVFHGGALEENDFIEGSNFIRKNVSTDNFQFAHYVAAARELFEEVGVLLCHLKDDSPVLLDGEKGLKYRSLLLTGKISFLEMLRLEQLYLTVQNLQYFGHFITPKEKPIRYDTRFFLAKLPKGQSPKPDMYEIDEANWYSPADALLAFQNKQILLAPPTVFALKSVKNYLDSGQLGVMN